MWFSVESLLQDVSPTATLPHFVEQDGCSQLPVLLNLLSLNCVNICSDGKSVNVLFGFSNKNVVSHMNYFKLAGLVDEAD